MRGLFADRAPALFCQTPKIFLSTAKEPSVARGVTPSLDQSGCTIPSHRLGRLAFHRVPIRFHEFATLRLVGCVVSVSWHRIVLNAHKAPRISFSLKLHHQLKAIITRTFVGNQRLLSLRRLELNFGHKSRAPCRVSSTAGLGLLDRAERACVVDGKMQE